MADALHQVQAGAEGFGEGAAVLRQHRVGAAVDDEGVGGDLAEAAGPVARHRRGGVVEGAGDRTRAGEHRVDPAARRRGFERVARAGAEPVDLQQ